MNKYKLFVIETKEMVRVMQAIPFIGEMEFSHKEFAVRKYNVVAPDEGVARQRVEANLNFWNDKKTDIITSCVKQDIHHLIIEL